MKKISLLMIALACILIFFSGCTYNRNAPLLNVQGNETNVEGLPL